MQFSPLCDDMRVYEEEEEEGSSLQLFAATVRNRISNTTELEMQSLLGGTNSEHENSNRNAGNNHSSSLFTRNFTHAGNTNNNSVVSSSFAVEKEEDEQASTARHKIICPMKNLHVRTSKSSDETDPEVFMTRTLSQIDILEDDFDEFTHKKLLPVPIQIALEENIFGWSHLLSDVLGHILYPLISAVFTYQAISLCYYAFNVYDGRSASSYHQQQQQQQQQHNNGEKEEDQSKSLSPFLVGVRNLMTVASLIASYRTVRRRRKVWLTHYDPKLIYSVDRDTEMGRKWHDQYYVQHSGGGSNKSSKLRKKVERASRKYDAKLRQVQKKKTTGQEVILAKKRETPSSTTTTATDMNILACSSSVVTKISHINNMLYTHGGYFASAPYMLHDPQWIYILRQLMPDVYVEVARRVHLGDAKLIHWAENNPVVAAYGTIMSCTSSSSSSTAIHNNNNKKNSNGGGNIHSNINMDVAGAVALEWDVFLDPILTSHLVTALDVQSTISKNETTQLKHVNNLIQTRALHLVANMLIAHGNATQLIMEQIPYPRIVKSYNFTRVKHARKTLGGGIEVSRWLAIYAAALKMGWKSNSKSKSNYQQNSAASTPLQSPENSSSDEDEDEDDTEGDEDSPEHLLAKLNQSEHIPLRTSIATVKKLMNKELTVLLDIKSRHVDKRGMCKLRFFVGYTILFHLHPCVFFYIYIFKFVFPILKKCGRS